jgi:hypothetical protein
VSVTVLFWLMVCVLTAGFVWGAALMIATIGFWMFLKVLFWFAFFVLALCSGPIAYEYLRGGKP